MVRFEVGANDAVAAKGKAAGGAATIGWIRVAVIAGLDTQVHETIAAEGESAKASAGIKGRIVAVVASFALLNNAVTTAGEAGTSMTDEPTGQSVFAWQTGVSGWTGAMMPTQAVVASRMSRCRKRKRMVQTSWKPKASTS